MTSPVRVMLVDDHAVVREGYRRLLEHESDIEVVGEAGNAAQACERALALSPDVVVMDIALPGNSGIEAMRRMLSDRPQLRVLIFSMHDDAIFSTRALQGGALGYLSKASAPEVLLQAIRVVSRGERYVSPDVAANIARSASVSGQLGLETLTAREFEVLRLLLQGETLNEIGERLGLSEKTVANHQSAIREKLGAKNSMQLARLGARLGLA